MLCSLRAGRPWLIMSSQIGLHAEYMEDIRGAQRHEPSSFIILEKCVGVFNESVRCTEGGAEIKQYPQILQVR